jgi:chromosome segregation ATPase
LPVLQQVQVSDQQQAVADAHHQLQQQQERYTNLQAQRASEQSDAAAAAQQHQQQLEERHQLVQQLQEELNSSSQQETTLQDSCNDYVKQVERLTMELSAADASAQAAQVSSAALSNSFPLFRKLAPAPIPCATHILASALLQRFLLFRLSCFELCLGYASWLG